MMIKRKLAMMLSVMMLLTSASPVMAETVDGETMPVAEQGEQLAASQELPATPEPTATPTPKPIAAPGANIETAEDSVTIEIIGEKDLLLYADLSGDTRKSLHAGDSVTFTDLAAGVYELEVNYEVKQGEVHAFRTSVPVAGRTTPAPQPVSQSEPVQQSGAQLITPEGSTSNTQDSELKKDEQSSAGLITPEGGAANTQDSEPKKDEQSSAGLITPEGSAANTQDSEPKKDEQSGAGLITPEGSAANTQDSEPKKDEQSGAELIKPEDGAANTQDSEPKKDEQSSAELIKPEDGATNTPSSETTTPESVKQPALTVSESGGVITAQVSNASAREVEVTLLSGETECEKRSLIGEGSVTFSQQNSGIYTVRAAYVTPAEGIVAAEKTVEIRDTSTSETQPEPTVVQIEANVTSGDNWIEVTVTQASAAQLYVAVGNEVKLVYAGASARFDALYAGKYEIEVDYVDPVSGVSPFRSSVTITKAPAGSFVFSATGGENRIEVIVSEASVLPITIQVKQGDSVTASKTLESGVGKAVFDSIPAGEYTVVVNYNPAQQGTSEKQQTVTVTEPASKPAVKEIASSATGGVEKIDVSVTDASNLPVKVTVTKNGVAIASQTIAAGVGKVTFTGLAEGSYTVSVNYDPAQDGIAAQEHKDVAVTSQKATVTLTSVVAGENVLTVTGTAQPGADIAVTTTPAAAAATIVRADVDGNFTAQVTLQAGTYTAVRAAYVADNAIFTEKSGSFVVTAPAVKPELRVDPITNTSMTVLAKTTPGVKVNLWVEKYIYGQTVVADANGLLHYSLPQTYPNGTVVTFTVFYGTNNAQSYKTTVNIADKEKYTILKYCDKGGRVTLLTRRLKELGYLSKETSFYSAAVRDAVKLFQQYNGLSVDGIAGQKTQTQLHSVGAIPYGAQGAYPTLVRGNKGLVAINALQRRLKELGYYTISVDGIYGSGTERAVRQFQRVNGLPATGIADSAMQKLLYSSSAKAADSAYNQTYETLYRSSRYRSAVVTLQRRLKALGYAVGSIDGYFGSRTYRAVRDFQRRNGITVTGIADEETQRVLYSASAVAWSASSSSSSGYTLLYWGCKGSEVKRLQQTLLSKGYTQVKVADGIYGQWTYDAVRAFQKDHGLSVDGMAGKATQSALYGTK